MIVEMKRVYLDVCCLNRPFDDQEQERIHLESEAIRFNLKHLRQGDVCWVGSSVLNLEINRTPDIEKEIASLLFLKGFLRKSSQHKRKSAGQKNLKH